VHSRDTNNIGHKIKNEDKQNKKHNRESYKNELHEPTKKGLNPAKEEYILLFIRHPPCNSYSQEIF
jgi:hypothetical protein